MGDIFSLDTWRTSVSSFLDQLGQTVGHFLPSVAGAIFIVLVGWGVSRLVQALARRALRRFGLDRAAERMRLVEGLKRANIKSAPSAIVARIVFWILMLTFLLAAAETLGLRAVTVTIDRLVTYLPNLVAAVLIVVLGFVLGRIVQKLAQSGASVVGLPQAEKLGAAAHGLIVLITGVVAVEQLGLKTDVIVTVIAVLAATIGLTLGLAFALGARGVIAHILAGHYLRQTLASGKTVEVAGRKGAVEHVGAVSTVFKKGDRSWSVPNAALLDDVVVQ